MTSMHDALKLLRDRDGQSGEKPADGSAPEVPPPPTPEANTERVAPSANSRPPVELEHTINVLAQYVPSDEESSQQWLGDVTSVEQAATKPNPEAQVEPILSDAAIMKIEAQLAELANEPEPDYSDIAQTQPLPTSALSPQPTAAPVAEPSQDDIPDSPQQHPDPLPLVGRHKLPTMYVNSTGPGGKSATLGTEDRAKFASQLTQIHSDGSLSGPEPIEQRPAVTADEPPQATADPTAEVSRVTNLPVVPTPIPPAAPLPASPARKSSRRAATAQPAASPTQTQRSVYLESVRNNFKSRRLLMEFQALRQRLEQSAGGSVAAANTLFLDCETARPAAETIIYLAATPREGQQPNVLLIDGDVDDCRLSQRLGLDTHRGLVDAARGFELDCLIHPIELPQTYFLPAGRDGESIQPDSVRSIIVQLSQVFDFVLISGGKPENKLIPCLNQECGESFLVVRLGSSDRSSAVNTLDLLEAAGVKPSGCIVANIQADHNIL